MDILKDLEKKIARNIRGMDAGTLFRHPVFRKYVDDTVTGILNVCYRKCGKKNPPRISIRLLYDGKSEVTAMTDSSTQIILNTANTIIQNGKTLQIQFQCALGCLAHEISHILFLDGPDWVQFLTQMRNTGDIPEMSFADPALQVAYEEMKENLRDKQEARALLAPQAKWLGNALNDAVDEYLLCRLISGYYKRCLHMVRSVIYSVAETLEESEEKMAGLPPAEKAAGITGLLMSQALLYAKHGKTKLGDYRGALLEDLFVIRDIIDQCRYCNDTVELQKCVIGILTVLWKYNYEVLQEYEGREETEGSEAEKSEGTSGEEKAESRDADGKTGEKEADTKPEDGKEEDVRPSMEELVKRIADACGADEHMPSDSCGELAREEPVTGKPFEADVSGDEAASADRDGAISMSGEPIDDTEESGESGRDPELERLIKGVARELAVAETERGRASRLAMDAHIFKGHLDAEHDFHRDINLKVIRAAAATAGNRDAYEVLYREVGPIAKACSRRLSREIRERKETERRKGLYYGRFDRGSLLREDGKNFYRNSAPFDRIDLCVCLLLDESGSMDSFGRIPAMKKMAVVVDAFARELAIPCLIAGHSTDNALQTEIYDYREFESLSKQDSFQIMKTQARNQNRDGLALEYCVHRLQERSERNRLLIVVSDGEPFDPCGRHPYTGEAAVSDMKRVIKKARVSGIRVVGAAIGSDRERIREIYGKQYFLNIEDLDMMPGAIVSLIKNYIVV